MLIHTNTFAANFGKFKTFPNGKGEVFKRPCFWDGGKGRHEHPEGGDYCRYWQRGNGTLVSPDSVTSATSCHPRAGAWDSPRAEIAHRGQEGHSRLKRPGRTWWLPLTPLPPHPSRWVGITCLSVVAVSHPLGLGNWVWGDLRDTPFPEVSTEGRQREGYVSTAGNSWILNSAFHKSCSVAITLAKFKLPLFSGLRNPLREKGEIFKVRNEKWWGEEGTLWSRLKKENCFWS